MFAPLALSITTASLTLLFVLLIVVERARGVRYAASLRESLDRAVMWFRRSLRVRAPQVSHGAVRAIFHYLAHQCLSLVLRVVRKSEDVLVRVVRLNRSKALSAREPDPHLRAIAEHKEAVSLTPAEKRKRKNQALRGE